MSEIAILRQESPPPFSSSRRILGQLILDRIRFFYHRLGLLVTPGFLQHQGIHLQGSYRLRLFRPLRLFKNSKGTLVERFGLIVFALRGVAGGKICECLREDAWVGGLGAASSTQSF